VQHPVAQGGWFAAGQFAVHAERLGPGEQVGGGQRQFEPHLGFVVAAAGQVAQSCCFAAADAVLDAGVGAVPHFQVGQLPGAGVGEERGEAVPVNIGESHLRAGVGSFAAHDDPRPGRPFAQLEQAAEFGDPRPVTRLAIDVIGLGPGILGQGEDRLVHRLIDAEPSE
jgi:hypothetical protein